jgi:hypothetical protein
MSTQEMPACGTTPVEDHESAPNDPPAELAHTPADPKIVKAACDALEDRAQSRFVALHVLSGGGIAANEPKSAYTLGRVDALLNKLLAGRTAPDGVDALLLDRVPPRGWFCRREDAIGFVLRQS